LPTLAERIERPFEVQTWGGLIAPALTPRDIVETLNTAANAALAAQAVRRTLTDGGYEISGGTAAAFKAFLRDEAQRWSDVISEAGLQGR